MQTEETRNCLIRCDGIEDIDLAPKRERELARILDRDFRGWNVEGVGGNVFDDGTNVFYGVGAVMDVLVGGVAVVVFGGDDLVQGIIHCVGGRIEFGVLEVSHYAGEET